MRLRRFLIFDTNSRDEVRDALVNHVGASDFSLRRDSEPFHGIGGFLRLKSLELSYCNYSADVRVAFPGDKFVRQPFALSGSGQVTVGRSQFHVNVNDAIVVPAGVKASYDFGKDLSQLMLRIDATALRDKLAALIGRPIGRSIEFSTSSIPQNPAQLRLRRLLEFFVSEIDREDANFTEFELTECEQALMMAFLAATPHNFGHLLKGGPPSAAPWQVHVVEEYIEANWNRPITIETLAAETGVGMRSMFTTFKRARGYSPMAFLRHIRLKQARRMLQAADHTTSVTAVGFLCGFNSSGFFARDYQKAFGELPSATLAAAKRALRRGRQNRE
jgi:AraC-like DNA-binding protein